MIGDILTGIPLGFFLSFLIGPVFFVLLETSAVKGFRAAIIFDLGVVLADIFFIAVAYFSSYRLIQTIKNDPAIFIFGGILMLTYGLVSFIRLRKIALVNDDEEVIVGLIKKNYFSLFVKGFLLNFINVGVLLFWFLILITIGPKLQLETSRMITFFSSVIGTYLVVDAGKILLAKQLRHKLTPTNILKVKKLISLLLIVFGLAIMLQGWYPSDQKMVKKALEKIE
ncbi:LysE family translocator [Flavobacterium sp. GT3R68]|uniref:LysE family translocator n=1 Tax=Flavobacterium sp. GT3R68 TaxID=2594437 RepID=UPI000F861E01|nr:LysE family transporter [Flavobacterium sp. GT3R68]RTY95890.1 LysE family translocator [Flavobacterium sp. GSN2]TRW93662.1 LysE family translocator [Flavobacterium sp. GT3R68]